jgi:hypothetical protein
MAKKATDELGLRTFKLSAATVADLDLVAADLTRELGGRQTRTDALRTLAHRAAQRIRKKIRNSR